MKRWLTLLVCAMLLAAPTLVLVIELVRSAMRDGFGTTQVVLVVASVILGVLTFLAVVPMAMLARRAAHRDAAGSDISSGAGWKLFAVSIDDRLDAVLNELAAEYKVSRARVFVYAIMLLKLCVKGLLLRKGNKVVLVDEKTGIAVKEIVFPVVYPTS